ncbi:toll-like receptor 21 [Anabas testudineus]|uniref:TIR domain-containing protein n=1 Tax=Anabas testudineus TaxID=64144 RepID=A0A3Q1J974_ANATE|nr:toll-like receptor 21 [Anabas testudineus]
MASLTQLLSVTVVLGAFKLISGYSFKNCIADAYSKGKSFTCIHRKQSNMSAIVNDLPHSAINLTISINPLSHIPNNSFVNLPNLQHLKIDHNHLMDINEHAFDKLYQLKSLNLSFNYISKLSPSVFNDLHNLTFLSLTNNTIKQLHRDIFFSVVNLETLLLRQNFLSHFSEIAESVSHLRNLKTLDLCFNNLTSLSHSNVSLPKSLTILYLCRNNLFTLGCKPSFLRFIQILDLSYNSRLPAMAFEGVDLGQTNYLRLRSTGVKIAEFLNISNINANHVDFSGTGLKDDNLLAEFCTMLKAKVKRIKNLDLGNNRIRNLTKYTLFRCPDITGALDLSRNELKNTRCLNFLRQTNIRSFNAEHNHLTSLQGCKTRNMVSFFKLKEMSYRYNRILSVNSYAFYHTPNITELKLNINTIAFLHRKALKGLKKLETLRLDNNLLTDLFNDTFEDNVNLKILNLRNNRISVIFNGTFLRLTKLTTLDLGGNKITHFEPSGLDGLKRLSKFYLDGNNLKQIESSLSHVFQDTLTVLDLAGNQIRFLSENIKSPPFVNLSKLSDLKLDAQRPFGLTVLPRTLFRGLRSLKSLYLTNNYINHLPPDAFDDLTGLHFLTLDNCCVGVIDLQPGVFKNLRNVTKLIVENMGIQNFSKEIFENFTRLHTLQLNRNVMQSINVDALESLPKLQYLDVRNIPLSCTCLNQGLQDWTLKNVNVQVVYLYNLSCQNDENYKFYNFDTKVCYIDLGESLFFSTAAVIFLFTVIPILYVKLYWKMKYSYYVFRSWFGEQWRRLKEEEENCKFDAFISYNSSDEQWVMDQLLPNLEGNGSSFKLCLHHRDFEPGRYIVDNIVSAVYSSRKTICVVSRNFLQSEWCSLEIQLASYRLFDEHRDVLLLVFLEPISERQMSSYHRMRKVMLKKTYLQWPGSDCDDPEPAQDLFWNKLRRAMRTGSRVKTEESDKSEGCVTDESKDNEISDENYYLLP